MKAKRSGYAKKASVNRQDQQKVQSTGSGTEVSGNAANDSNCNGLCTIHWKPVAVAK